MQPSLSALPAMLAVILPLACADTKALPASPAAPVSVREAGAPPGAPPTHDGCRESRFSDSWKPGEDVGTETLEGQLDVDGDSKIDTFSAMRGGGSDYFETNIELHLSASNATVTAVAGAEFSSMMAFHRVPAELTKPGLSGALGLVEEVFFDNICPSPEPSLKRLIAGAEPEWVDGKPVIAPTYVIYSQEPAVLALAAKQGFAGEENVTPDTAHGVWVEYLSTNHRRASDQRLSGDLRLVDSKESLGLWVTAHGVVAVDEAANRYAWLYVYPGGRKLRFPSIKSAKFEGTAVVIEMEPTKETATRHQVRVELSTSST